MLLMPVELRHPTYNNAISGLVRRFRYSTVHRGQARMFWVTIPAKTGTDLQIGVACVWEYTICFL